MIFKLLDEIASYLSGTPYWSAARPIVALLSLYVTALVLAYQFIVWQYQLYLPLSLFLVSYLVKQITVVCGATGLAVLVLGWRWHRDAKADALPEAPRRHFLRRAWPQLIFIALIVAATVAVLAFLSPRAVSNIRVKFLQEPGVDKYALAYLLYELNRTQKYWFFEVDFDVFNENALTAQEREHCAGSNQALCYAEGLSGGRPFIGITTEKLGEDFFWQHRDTLSVVSTYGWKDYAPPSEYEFLVHAIIVQSILIHLTAHCSGLPVGAFKVSRVSHNDLFQFVPRRRAMKSAILAAHVSRRGEELLFNCFGPQYLVAASQVLTLDWLHTGKVPASLERGFRVKL